MNLIAPDSSAIYPTFMEYEQDRQKHTDPTATQQAPQVGSPEPHQV